MTIRGSGAVAIVVVILAGVAAQPGRAADRNDDNGFFYRDGDVVVFYGDSITDNTAYPRVIENYILTRFPDWRVTFFNLGWSGDQARFLSRVIRDVFHVRPTAFTECMGMNDGEYRTATSELVNRHRYACVEMVRLLRRVDPDMRIALVSAPPYENRRSHEDKADGAYPQTLRVLSEAKRQAALETDVRFVDLFARYAARLGAGNVVYPDFHLSPDGVHPDSTGQAVMALEILKGLGAPMEIARLAIDASGPTPRVTDSARCRVTDLKRGEEGGVRFRYLAEALPCPVESLDDTAWRFLDVTGFCEINQETLSVGGLDAPGYEVRMNDVVIGAYPASELAAGVNLARAMKGPRWEQAVAVADATCRRQRAHHTKWRTVWLDPKHGWRQRDYSTSDAEAIVRLDAEAAAAIRDQHALNRPQWVNVTVRPLKHDPLRAPESITYTSAGIPIARPAPLVGATKAPPASTTPLPPAPPGMAPLDWTRARVRTVDLRSAANRAFADDLAGDGKGGWSDQGPGKDLRDFPVGRQALAGVPFDVIDSDTNAGCAMLVLSRREGQNAPREATIPVNARATTLALLVASAWTLNDFTRVDLTIRCEGRPPVETSIVAGEAFYDWDETRLNPPVGCRAWTGRIGWGDPVSVFYVPVANPYPDATIREITLSIPRGRSNVFGLIAITALVDS